MSDVFKFVKKVFTLGVVSTTMLWSVGASFLVTGVANAAYAAVPGSRVKVVGRPAIYAVNNAGQVLYFPSGFEHGTWFPSYAGYNSISQADFDSLSVPATYPGAVNVRYGTAVVKRASSDQLYVVEPGNTLAKITPEAAKALYGSTYKAYTVADAFWPHYVNRGADVTEAKPHAGMLVSNGGKNWFVNADGTLSEVTSAGFTANGFQAKFVRPVTDAMIAGMSFGPQINALVPALADLTQGGGITNTTPVTGVSSGNLTVGLASDNPAGSYLASGSAFNKVLKLTLSAGSGTIKVTSLKIRRIGFFSNSYITGVDVIDSKGVRHGNVVSSLSADNDALLTFTNDPIVVTAGSPETATVRINLVGGASTGVVQFQVLNASSVGSDGTVGGSFPISGNQFNVQDGSTSIASVTVLSQSVNGYNNPSLNADGNNQQEITKFQFTNGGSYEAVNLKSLTIYNNGTAADSDVKDVQLVDQTGAVLATSQMMNKTVVFDLSATPYFLDKGLTKSFTVRAKLVNGASRTVAFVIYNDYDVVAVGTSSGASVLPTTNDSHNATATSFPVGGSVSSNIKWNQITIGSGSISFNKDSSSPSSAVVPGATNVVLAKFFAKPTGENMELRKIGLSGTYVNTALNGTVYVKVNDAVVYSMAASSLVNNTAATATYSLSTYPTLKAGENSYITVEANISSSATSSEQYRIYLDLTEVKRLITNDIVDPAVTKANGNIVAVNSASLNVTTLTSPVSQSVVAGTNNFTFARFELNAGTSGEDVKVSTLVVSSTRTGAGADSDIANLVMYDAEGKPLATTNSTVTNGATVTFNFATPILVTRTAPVVLTLKADVVARTASETFTYSINGAASVTASGKTTGNSVSSPGVYGVGQAMTIAAGGTGTLSLVSGASGAPSIDQVVTVGTPNVNVFAFTIGAQNEALKLTTLKLTATGDSLASNDAVNLRLYRGTDVTPFATGNQMTCSSNTCTFTWTATDNLLPEAVQPGAPMTVYVKADVGATGSAVLGDSFKFMIAATSTDFIAKGAFSGADVAISGTPTAGGTSYIAPFSVVVSGDAPTAGSSQTQAILAGTQLGRFKVTNNGTAQITLTSLLVTDSGSHTGTSSTFKLQYSDQNSNNYTTYTATTTTAVATTTFSNFATPITIDGGSYRYFTVALGALGYSTTGDTFNLSVASLGHAVYSVTETNLGYEGNANNNALADTITGLYADGKPNLGTLVKQ